MAWKKLTTAEIALAKRWHLEEGLSAAKIAERLGRAPSTISRLVIKKVVRKRQGRNILLSPAIVDKIEAKLEAMIIKADVKREITAAKVKRATR